VDIEGLGYPMGRIYGLFMPKMMHKSFQAGLADLKKLCEAYFAKSMIYKTGEITVNEHEAWQALVIKDSSTCDKVDVVFSKVYGEIQQFMKENKIECTMPPFARYFKWDEKENKFVMEAGFPVQAKVKGNDHIYFAEYPKMKVATAIHHGAYETSYFSYQAIEKYIEENGMKQQGVPWEVYLTDPEKEKEVSKLQTQIFYPVE
jgi:effector-binding domain-containing protein